MPKRTYTQANRRMAITTPLGEDVLLLRSLTGSESISRLFEYHLDLLSEDDAIAFDAVVGKPVNVRIVLADGSARHWNGIVSRFSQGGSDGGVTSYHAEMVPWLWFCTRTADCRIFQRKTVPDIVKQIFADLKLDQFELRLVRLYAPRDYCVQYRESDFNFVSRLMEEEGIFYFFEHGESSHKLIVADDCSAHKPCPAQEKAHYQLNEGGWREEDLVHEWRSERSMQPGKWAQTDYNFENPSTDLMVTVDGSNSYEIYDYPGEYAKRAEGDSLVKIRLQEETAAGLVVQGGSKCRAFQSGFVFDLEDHYRSDLNGKYLLTSVQHRASQGGDYETTARNGAEPELSYTNSFTCIPAAVPYRPTRVTQRPRMQGCQTAVVVGPAGEEIYTDQYGRVKVQFHWDREGKRNENSSCWVRVSHPWAGKGWGAVSIPRIGQEVVVDFLEGDPDQPLIVGRVYNAECMPPYGLPGGAVVSGIKSDSTKGGGGYNEIALDDTKGKELMRVHAQYDKDKVVEHDERVNVKNDRTENVGHDESIVIGHDKGEIVKHDRALLVEHDKSERVNNNKSIVVEGDHTERISGGMVVTIAQTLTESVLINYAETVGGAMELTVGGALAISVGAAMAETVGGAKAETIGGVKAETIGGNKSLTVGKNLTETIKQSRVTKIDKDLEEKILGKHNEEVAKEYRLTAKKVQIVAEDEVHLKAGGAELILKKNGDIQLKGKKINIKGSGDVVIKGSKIKEN